MKKIKCVAIIPIKLNSERVPGKNLKKINGKPLYSYLLDTLLNTKFNEVYVDTDSYEIKKYSKKLGYIVIDRIPKLAKSSANGNDLINYHSTIIEADYYFQLFVTAPLLKKKTINNCIKILKNNKKYDSILTSKSIFSWFWFKNKPVNYNPKILPRSQDAIPIVCETTGLYGIKKQSLTRHRTRIGKKPFFYEVSNEESIDLDTKEDFNSLKYYLREKSK